MRLNILAFGLACGIMWGFGVFFLTWWIIAFMGVTRDPIVLGYLYRVYNVSPIGSVIGLAWALADGFVGGVIFAWLYNLIAGKIQSSGD